MSYTALYRKWRPASFEDVKGQDHIVKTLKNQVESGRIGHAYLFCGTRGTGKTSIAKIFARAVNCEHPKDGSPCNECETCKRIKEGASLNVVEIDAASNNGVENIREIREQVQYPPTEGKYRVYIIDEVHMLSIGAFNALLKTLEEPPSYVIFILATTEVHKIPITILSRCQRYDFKRISLDTIAGRLKELTEAEHIEAEERALRYVAKAADGSMRDALSLLDQCAAFHFGESLTYDNVLEVLGAVDNSVFSQLFRAAVEGRAKDCISAIEEIDSGQGAFAVCHRFYLVSEKSSDCPVCRRRGEYPGYVHGKSAPVKGRSGPHRWKYADALYPHFLRAVRADALCQPEESAFGDSVYQADKAFHGAESGFCAPEDF